MNENLEFYQKEWVMWLALFFFAPIGIFLMWKYNKKLKENLKIFLSVIFTVFFVLIWIPSCVGISSISGNSNSQNTVKIAEQNKLVAQETESKIKAIGDPKAATLEKTQIIKSAKISYDGLTNDQKGLIPYDALKTLIIAEDTVASLESKTVELAQPAVEKAVPEQTTAGNSQPETASQAQSATETESTGTVVYITESGKKYHLDGCSSLSKSKILIDLEKAKSQGFTPCSNCDPPQ
ncbi:hypothetical protein [Acetobacterium wieringae]|uniref:hypothetical protein n=1 Tax=Acetobacterium wieringae TaxID=52694 RepID=UPI0026EFC73D|nr:hypothetical protein [Acetobacterium wieringae]